MRERPRLGDRAGLFRSASLPAAFARYFARGMGLREPARGTLVKQFHRPAPEPLRNLLEDQQRDILLASLHRAGMRSADADSVGGVFLTKTCRETQSPHVQAKDLADVHPIDGAERLFYCHVL